MLIRAQAHALEVEVPDRLKEKVWFDVPDAALYLGMTERWVRRQIADRHIEFNKVGNRIRFRREVLDAMLAAGDVSASNGPPREAGRESPGRPVTKKRTKQRKRRKQSAA